VKNQITKGNWVVRSVVRVDEAARQIWFMAGGIVPGQDPYFAQLPGEFRRHGPTRSRQPMAITR
jgi:hypothetical protein